MIGDLLYRDALVLVFSFQGRKENARGRNGGTTRGIGSRSLGRRWAVSRSARRARSPRPGPGDITFIESERFAKLLRSSPASAAIVGPHFNAGPHEMGQSLAVIEVDDPMSAFLAVRTHLDRRPEAALDGNPSAGLRRVQRPGSVRTWRSIRSPTWATTP